MLAGAEFLEFPPLGSNQAHPALLLGVPGVGTTLSGTLSLAATLRPLGICLPSSRTTGALDWLGLD